LPKQFDAASIRHYEQWFTTRRAWIALGLKRLITRQSSELSADGGESSLHFTPDQSGAGSPTSREPLNAAVKNQAKKPPHRLAVANGTAVSASVLAQLAGLKDAPAPP
jgi:hypothetical protein